ncbi:MAG TPA: flagellar hook-length control protein FliK [Gammaproteobacteria bacterium]
MLNASSVPAGDGPAPQADGPQGAERRADAGLSADAFAALIALLVAPPSAPAASGAEAATALDVVEGAGARSGRTLPPGGKPLPPAPAGDAPATAPTDAETSAQPAAARDGLDAGRLLAAAFEAERSAGEAAAKAVAGPAAAREPTTPAAREPLPAALALAVDPTAPRGEHRAAGPETAASQQPPAASFALEFEEAVGRRVVWMLEQGVHDARLHVHPDDLGPIDIHVVTHDDAADVTFHAGHAHARDAITDALPRLRELLGAAGLDLGTVSVDVRGDAQPERGPERDVGERAGTERAAPGASAPRRRVALPRGLIDTFA